MCFRVKKNKELIAKEDIVCYKVGDKYNKRLLFKDTFYPYYEESFKYKVGNLYKLNKILKVKVDWIGDIEIHEGFHSWIQAKGEYGECLTYLYPYRPIVQCIIPKGAKYYENDSQYVSDSIIIKKMIH